jgi:hypothetical protein
MGLLANEIIAIESSFILNARSYHIVPGLRNSHRIPAANDRDGSVDSRVGRFEHFQCGKPRPDHALSDDGYGGMLRFRSGQDATRLSSRPSSAADHGSSAKRSVSPLLMLARIPGPAPRSTPQPTGARRTPIIEQSWNAGSCRPIPSGVSTCLRADPPPTRSKLWAYRTLQDDAKALAQNIKERYGLGAYRANPPHSNYCTSAT